MPVLMAKEMPGFGAVFHCQGCSVPFSLETFISSHRFIFRETSYFAEIHWFGFIWGFCWWRLIMRFEQESQGKGTVFLSRNCQEDTWCQSVLFLKIGFVFWFFFFILPLKTSSNFYNAEIKSRMLHQARLVPGNVWTVLLTWGLLAFLLWSDIYKNSPHTTLSTSLALTDFAQILLQLLAAQDLSLRPLGWPSPLECQSGKVKGWWKNWLFVPASPRRWAPDLPFLEPL